jgi:hypothetical protein
MRQRFTKWYAQKYGLVKGPWWVELLTVFLFSPSVYFVEMHKLYYQSKEDSDVRTAD